MVKKNMLPRVPTENPIALRSLAEAVPVAMTRATPASNIRLNIVPLLSVLACSFDTMAVGQRAARAATGRCRGRRAGVPFGSARRDHGQPRPPRASPDPRPSCLAAGRCWDQARWAIGAYAWRFDGLARAPEAGGTA